MQIIENPIQPFDFADSSNIYTFFLSILTETSSLDLNNKSTIGKK